MKHNLGKSILLLLLICFVFLQAEDFTHTLHADKTDPFVKEAVILTLELKQTNPNIVLMFDFDLRKSENYTFQRLDTQETDNHPGKGLHTTYVKYVYLIYPLHAGKISLHFNLTKKVTTDESVAYSFSGDRDNVKTLVTKDTPILLSPLVLQVKPLPKGTQIVGDFSVDYQLQKHKANPYEPLPFQITLKGLGYPPLIEPIPKDVNFTLFTEKPFLKSQASLQGLHNTVRYAMALSHDRNFTLPAITIKGFSPKRQKPYTLTVPEQKFAITPVDKHTLLDKVDTPEILISDWSWLYTFFTYILIFIAGFFTAYLGRWTKKIQIEKGNPIKEKVQNAKDAKALLQILLANDSHRFSKQLELLENSLYANGKINLNKVKQEVTEIL